MVQPGFHLSQDVSLRQEQVIAPHQIQSLEILAVSLLDLQARINQEVQENPTLEQLDSESEQLVGDPVEDLSGHGSKNEDLAGQIAEKDEYLANLMQHDDGWRDYVPPSHAKQYATSDDEEKRRYFFDSLTADKTLGEDLLDQVRMSDATEKERTLAELIVGNIGDSGYLRTPLEELADMSNVPVKDLRKALKLVQTFDPPGVGARDLRECLLIQLRRDEKQDTLAYKIVDKYLDQIARNRIPQVSRALRVSSTAIYEALNEIKQLQPSPGNAAESAEAQYVLAELSVEKIKGEWVVKSNRDYVPRLRISNQYMRILEDPNVPSEVKSYVREKINGGNFLIKSIHQRQDTLQKIAEIIVRIQEDFLEYGKEALHPLTMSQVAEEMEVHETTVSRAIANKYIQTPRGLFPLKFFFTGGFTTEDGEELSSHSIRAKIKAAVSEENPAKPLSDQKIVQILKDQGLNVARRTVAKYREELGIPSSHLRKSHGP